MYGNPYAPPPQNYFPPPAMGAWASWAYRQGAALVLSRGSQLPPVCVKCGQQHGITQRRVTFSWTPPWAYFTIFLGSLIGLIVIAMTRKSAFYTVPICEPCNKQWSKANLMFGLSFLPGLGFLLLSFLFAAIDEPDLFGIALLVSTLGLIVTPILVAFVYSRPKKLWVERIDDRAAYVRGMNVQAMDAACLAAQAAQPPAPPAPYVPYGPQPGYGYGPPPPAGGFGAPY